MHTGYRGVINHTRYKDLLMLSISQLQDLYTACLPELSNMAAASFRHLDPESKQEAIQNTLTMVWKSFMQLNENGRANEDGILKSVVWYAVKQTKSGRSVVGCLKSTDILAQRGRRTKVESLDLRDFESKHASIPETVSWRLDFPRFLAMLSARQQQITKDLMLGETTADTAKKYRVSPAAISQHRYKVKERLEEFYA